MFKSFLTAVVTVVLSFSILQAEIIETNQITDVLEYVNEESLVFFNVTDTLYAPSITLADHAWRTFFAKKVREKISNKEIAEYMINKVSNEIVNKIPKKPVDERTAQIIEELQDRTIPVLGLTKKNVSTPYAEDFAEITSRHIKSVGVDLEKTMHYLSIAESEEGDTSVLFDGILFTQKKPAGQAILYFLKRLDFQPKRLVIVDNGRDSLEEIEVALAESGIEFKGLRYGAIDELKAAFDPLIGTIQWITLGESKKIISDEEARLLKDQKQVPADLLDLVLDQFENTIQRIEKKKK
jgi:hypothetical protein